MIGLVHTAWLFTRGSQSVQIVRVGQACGAQRLLVNGPGTEAAVHHLDDPLDCIRYQSEVERQLVAQGFRLAHFSSADRRTGRDRRSAPRGFDRRRTLELVV